MTEFKCLKDKWQHVFLTIHYVIIQKTMSPRKSKEDVISFVNPRRAEAVVLRCFFKIDALKNLQNFTAKTCVCVSS